MRTHPRLLLLAACLLPAATVVTSCRGEISNQPPIHIVPNMDFQEKLKAQSESHFPRWKDKRGMRLPVRGTIARGSLGIHDADPEIAKLHTYKNADGSFVTSNPLPKTPDVLARGRQRYEIHCAVCHGYTGRGDGIVGRKMAVRPPSFYPRTEGDIPGTVYKPQVLTYTDGDLFDVITNGRSTMQPYGSQVTPRDRWAIVHWVRVLQLRGKN